MLENLTIRVRLVCKRIKIASDREREYTHIIHKQAAYKTFDFIWYYLISKTPSFTTTTSAEY